MLCLLVCLADKIGALIRTGFMARKMVAHLMAGRWHAVSKRSSSNIAPKFLASSALDDYARTQRQADEAGNIINSETIHKLSAMRFNGLRTAFQEQCYRFGRLAFGDELEDFALA